VVGTEATKLPLAAVDLGVQVIDERDRRGRGPRPRFRQPQTPKQHSTAGAVQVRGVRTQRSANALAFGACTGVVMICAPSEANTSSKARVNLLSRSRIRNRGVVVSSGRSIKNSRARWTIHGPFGWPVTPAMRTCRVPSSMKNSRYSVVSRTVSTVKKSVARMTEACARRNPRQVTDARRGAGRSPLPSRTVRMVVADTRTSSFLSSPWMRR
jgi:hypothetical protein